MSIGSIWGKLQNADESNQNRSNKWSASTCLWVGRHKMSVIPLFDL